MTADVPLLVLVHAKDEQAAISRAESSALTDYDTVKVLDCQEGASAVWTVRLTVSSPKHAEAAPPPPPPREAAPRTVNAGRVSGQTP